jgi:predicted nucleic acid-binding protein
MTPIAPMTPITPTPCCSCYSIAPIALSATLTPGDLEVNAVAEVPTDNEVVACAVEGQAGYGIASDGRLLKLERYAQIVILPPRRFLDILEEIQPSGA